MHRFKADLQTLELDHNASREEIKQAYRDLVRVWHPDRFVHNDRLRQKAEAKLKRFNQAYEHLKGWQQPYQSGTDATGSPVNQRPAARPGRPGTARSQAQTSPRTRPSRAAPPASARRTPPSASTLEISFTEAEFILRRYHFEALGQHDPTHAQYQGGPFVLAVCETPPELMISVPCHSLQIFDRILLSIPCKSMGYFTHQDAQQLLALLSTQ